VFSIGYNAVMRWLITAQNTGKRMGF